MSDYEDDDKTTSSEKQSEKSTDEKPTLKPIKESLIRQEPLFQNPLKYSVQSIIEEQRKMMQNTLTPTLNTLRSQKINLTPVTSVLNEQRMSMFKNLSLTPSFERLKDVSIASLGQRLVAQRDINLSLGVSALKQTATHSVLKAMNQQKT